MKIGFLFPGQGSQKVGMGKDLYEAYEEVRKIYDEVSKITGINIKQISFEGPEEKLNETQNTQLAILTQSLAILEILHKNGITPQMSAGLSLGEYTALIEAKAISFKEGVKLVQKRGEIMHNLTPEGNWKMAAIIGLGNKEVEEVCSKVQSGFVVPANYNTIGQTVISGEEEAVKEAEEIAQEMGAKKVMLLNTAGPFHTEKLSKCSEALKKELEKVTINTKTNTKVIKNIDGKPYEETDNIKTILAKHITSPVRFDKVLQTMLAKRNRHIHRNRSRKNPIRLSKKNAHTKQHKHNKHKQHRNLRKSNKRSSIGDGS